MMHDIARHKGDYSILAVLSAVFIVYFLKEKTNPQHLVAATVVFGIFYFFWGVWHHSSTKTVTKHIVLEYFLVAVLGIVIVSSLLL